jgi:hypothetical protein
MSDRAPLEEPQLYVNCKYALLNGVAPVCVKLTGSAPPLVTPTVNVVLPTDCDPTVAVRLILLEALLAWVPTSVTDVVVVIVMVEVPFKKRAEPEPLVVARVNVIDVVLLVGETVAVTGAVLFRGTTGVPEKLTVGFTLPGELSAKVLVGQLLGPVQM